MEIAYWEPDDSRDNTRCYNTIQAKFSRGTIKRVTNFDKIYCICNLSPSDFNLVRMAYNPRSWSFGMPQSALKFYSNGTIIAQAWALSNILSFIDLSVQYKDNKKIIFKNKY